MSIDDMTPHEAYEAGYRAGESNIEADVDTLCDELDIEYEGHPITAVRAEIVRLRAELAATRSTQEEKAER